MFRELYSTGDAALLLDWRPSSFAVAMGRVPALFGSTGQETCPAGNAFQDFNRLFELGTRVGSGDDGPDAGFAFGDSGKTKRHSKHPGIKKLATELLCQRCFTQHKNLLSLVAILYVHIQTQEM